VLGLLYVCVGLGGWGCQAVHAGDVSANKLIEFTLRMRGSWANGKYEAVSCQESRIFSRDGSSKRVGHWEGRNRSGYAWPSA
jgi:hypothetical protein